MKHPWHYRGFKRKVGFFLLRHSLLTTRQWREVELSTDRPPRNHEEFMADRSLMEPERKMTRQQLEEMITRPLTWRDSCPTMRASSAAFALASVGELGGPESSLGATREAALRVLRRRLDALDVAKIEIILSHYDASTPHPQHVFGSGWSESDQRKQAVERIEIQREEGIETEEEWLANRRAHWHLRLVDRLLYWRRFAFALSLPRWYRELRYRPHRFGRSDATI
jgi:hypothetical protein